ncbi:MULTISPECIES: hypothetical protein [Pseudomonas]|uniref:hypothetical protein n=1 Tax=Pseudomonas TaxID=286 RepID=UPI0009DF5F43|nr:MULTISPECIES: hypothetical protein [Pseudomonas]MBH3436445.1 hypothetical protein [Pseudomonas citronellolis]WRT85821.1 hypothetical protein VK748_15790 [Pseudomonas citronellolis]
MLKTNSILSVAFILILVATPGICWLYVKLSLAKETEPFMTYWNDSRSCYINAYVPRFSSYGVAGKLVKLFSSDAFFRVYSKDGALLKSSEWRLWQREFAESEKAIWVGNRAVYPTNNGYEGWALDECH